MAEATFSDLGKVEAIKSLYEGTPFSADDKGVYSALSGDKTLETSTLMIEGTDFDLVYFPLKHLGYKTVVKLTGELYSSLAEPYSLSLKIGVSSKLDYAQIKELWSGVVVAATEVGIKHVLLDLVPSQNGLIISASSLGVVNAAAAAARPQPKSMDILAVTGNLGAAYMGLRLLEAEKTKYESGAANVSNLENYKMLVGAYLKPEISPVTPSQMANGMIIPSAAVCVKEGLADAVKRIVRETGLGAKIYADKIPFEGNTFELGKQLNADPVSAAMNGGDDFCLLLAIPIGGFEAFHKEFPCAEPVGHLAKPEVGTVLVTPEGAELQITAPSWKEE